jgi:hypothetical protein
MDKFCPFPDIGMVGVFTEENALEVAVALAEDMALDPRESGIRCPPPEVSDPPILLRLASSSTSLSPPVI